MALRTANPVLKSEVFESYRGTMAGRMTVEGAINKTGLLLVILVGAAAWTWAQLFQGGTEALGPWIMIAFVGALVLGLVTSFKADWAPYTAPAYALCEGSLLGVISAFAEMRYPGIAIKAVAGTFGVLAMMLLAYRTGLVRPTEKFKWGVIAATGGVCLLYLASMVLSLFHVHMAFLYDSSPLSILISLVVAAIAALNLILDFNFIEEGARMGAPARMEWYAGFGLLVTLVWLYLEILRLLVKLQGRGDSRDW
ncbi:MAG TPA: Bax inhibitor-1/YccA family protein [Candidatus Xenobia bacterium]|jgi:uncharacterized YccA/Bax inhibitor family protein